MIAPHLEYEYQVGGNLPPDAPTYVQRQTDQELYERLQRSEFCYILNSRQMGKSSLRVRTMRRLVAAGFACAVVDITAAGTQVTEECWYACIVDNLANSFSLQINSLQWWRERDCLSPVQRLSQFIERVLLVEIRQPIVIFIDEIDNILSLNFSTDDFFAAIRFCFNNRADNPEYHRLTFALFGVSTPSDLVKDKRRTPFNIGRAIQLTGFQIEEAQPLARGLVGKASAPDAVLRAVLAWTGGQPFLTQKLCKLVLDSQVFITAGEEAAWIGELVKSEMIQRWESQDDPPHLRAIRDRLLRNEQTTGRLLGLYHQILQRGEIAGDDSFEHAELLLSGLVVRQEGKLRVYNRIYESVFNEAWVEEVLASLRPYAERLTAWKNSNYQDESQLLRGQALQQALDSASNRSLSALDEQFLRACQKLERREFRVATIRRGIAVLALLTLTSVLTTVVVWIGIGLQQAQKSKELERAGFSALQNFESEELEALLSAMRDGKALKKLVGRDSPPLTGYPAINSLLALQKILFNIHERNQLNVPQGAVNGVGFSPDGQRIATVGEDGRIRLWSQPSGQQLFEWQSHQGKVLSVSFSPDGQRLVTAGADGTTRLWNLTGQQLVLFKGHQAAVFRASFSPDGQLIATAGADGTARLWNLRGKQQVELKVQGQGSPVFSVNFSPNQPLVATAGGDNIVRLWNLSGQRLREWQANQGQVGRVSFSPDGKHIATAGEDGTVRIWNLFGRQMAQLKGHRSSVYGVSFSPNDESIATASEDGTVRLWNLSGQQTAQLNGHQGPVLDISFSPDRNPLLITGGGDRTARLWDLSKKYLSQWQGHTGWINEVSLSPDGQSLATAGEDGKAILWNLSGKPLAQLQEHKNAASSQGQGVLSVSFSSDGQLLATAGKDRTVRLWNQSGQQLSRWKTNSPVRSVRFSPDRQLLATASEDGTIQIWRKQSGQQLHQWQAHTGRALSISFSPNRQLLTTAGEDGKVRVWNFSGQQLLQLNGHQGTVYSVSFSPDGQRLVTSGRDNILRLWTLSGKQVAEFNGHHRVYSVSFSPDGQYLATAGGDSTVRLWTLSGEQVAEFDGYQGRVLSVSFSRDEKHGQILAAVGEDGIVRLWPVENLDRLLARGCNWLRGYFTIHPDESEVCSNE